jgi:hypothetical protein
MNMSAAKDAGLIEKLRTWRRDASSLHQYEAAAFVGDKVLSITSNALQYGFNSQRTFRMRSGWRIFTFTFSRTREHMRFSQNQITSNRAMIVVI